MWRPSRLFALGLALSLLLVATVQAAEKPRAKALKLDEAGRAEVSRIETYLNGLKSVEARFVQVASTGDFAEGKLYLLRPGRLRIEYDPPKPDFLVADGLMLMHYDKELKQASHVLLDSTPAGLLVDENVRFNGEKVMVVSLERESGVVRLGLARAKDPAEGTLVMAFSEKPLALRKWTVIDAQGIATTVTLQNPVYGQPLDKQLFYLEPPKAP